MALGIVNMKKTRDMSTTTFDNRLKCFCFSVKTEFPAFDLTLAESRQAEVVYMMNRMIAGRKQDNEM